MKYTHCIECGRKVSKNCKKGHCSKCYDRSGKIPEIKIDKDYSYLIGFAQGDGSMYQNTRNRGKFSITINYDDRNILEYLNLMIPCHGNLTKLVKKNLKVFGRVYSKKIYSQLSVNNKGFRDFMLKCGVPYGKKDGVVSPPLHLDTLCVNDYIRGLIDADGSVGFTSNKIPFLSLTTNSDEIKDFIIDNISRVTGSSRKDINRNKRDNIYNIVIYKEDAVVFAKEVYYKGCLSIDRKYKNARDVSKWIRPLHMKKIDFKRKRWVAEEDTYLLSHSLEEASVALDRTLKSVTIRKFRLTKLNKVSK